jgi:hypothetical protein
MKSKIDRIIKAHLEENKKNSSNYVEPHRSLMDQFPYYSDQEVTDVHFQIDSPYGGGDGDYDLLKQMVYDQSDWQNADWAGGNFLSPYDNSIQKEFNRTPNSPENLYDPLRGASDISDLSSKTASTIDYFLNENNFVKVSSMDLENFLFFSDETLINKSTKDLWKMVKDKNGNVYISRLVEEDVLNDK